MNYAPRVAFKLGDRYKLRKNYFEAELFYSLALNTDHKLNKKISNVESQKYREKLEQLQANAREQQMILPAKGLKIPTDGLQLLQSFYNPWLNQVKPMMKVCTN